MGASGFSKASLSERCDVYVARIQILRPIHRGLLDHAERLRSAKYQFESDRSRFELGAVLLRLALGRILGTRPALLQVDRMCEMCGKSHGRPRVRGFDGYVSISHSGSTVAVAITSAGPVGIDVEATNGLPVTEYRSLLDLVVTTTERPFVDSRAAFLKVWTRKEAVLKAVGCGLRISMTEVVVSSPYEEPYLISFRSESAVPCLMREIDVGTDFCATLAVITKSTIGVLVQDAGPLLSATRGS